MPHARLLPRLLLAAALAAAHHSAPAQHLRIEWNPRSGDVWVDARLADINRYGVQYRESFIDELVRYHAAPRALVVDLLVDRGWAPGDVYYACAIARQLGRPCREVVDEWTVHHAQGWGAVARRLGIKPGSDDFHRLKKGFVPSYDRWGRPVVLDTELQRAYPQHGKPRGQEHGRGKDGSANDDDSPARERGGKGGRAGQPGKDRKDGKGKH